MYHQTALQILEFKNNQLITPPNSVVAEGQEKIMAYLREHDQTWVCSVYGVVGT